MHLVSVIWALPCECRWPGRAGRSCGLCKNRFRTPSWDLRCAIGWFGRTVACARTGLRLELSLAWVPRSSFLGRPSKQGGYFGPKSVTSRATAGGHSATCWSSLSLAFLHTPFFLPSCRAWRNSDALFSKTPTPARFVMVMKSSLASPACCMICVIGLTEINSKSVHHIHLGRTFKRDDKTKIEI